MVGKKVKRKKVEAIITIAKIDDKKVVQEIVSEPLVERKKFDIWVFLGLRKSE